MESPLTTLPGLNNTIELSGSVINAFRKNGHALINRLLLPDEVRAYRPALQNATEKYNTEKRRLADRDTYGKAFLQVMNLWTVDKAVQAFTLAKRFGKVAADLMGVKNVRIYHDQ